MLGMGAQELLFIFVLVAVVFGVIYMWAKIHKGHDSEEMTIECKHCGKSNPAGHKFCRACGKQP